MKLTGETVAILVAIVVPLAALLVWAMRAIVAPLGVVIENNTAAMTRIMDTVEMHGEKLEDHSVRIAKIETVHDIEDREAGR